jgi:nitroreductase
MYMELLRNRRSVRSFEDRPVEKEKVDLLVEAALRSPSSRGLNPWEFVVVTDKGKLKALSAAKPHGAGFLAGAPLGIVVTADPERCDVWIEDASIATILVQLAAESLGLASCWIQIRRRDHAPGRTAAEHVRQVLGIPSRLEVESMIAVGYPTRRPRPHGPDDLQFQKVHDDRYGTPFAS